MGGRSSIEQLDPAILDAVHAAIGRGRTIDEITRMLAELGAPLPRSNVGRYTKRFAEVAKQQRDMRSVAEAFGKEFGGAEDHQGRMMVQLLTSVITRSIMPIASEEEPELDGKELSYLARAVKDSISATKIDVDREAKARDEATKLAKRQAAEDAMSEGRAAGASEESLNRIRLKILGMDA